MSENKLQQKFQPMLFVLLATAFLSACGGGGGGEPAPPPDSYTVGGTVSGLDGNGLLLQNNGGDDLTINANGIFTFTTSIDQGKTYNVSVLTQPDNLSQTCSITNASGSISASNISDISISCVTNSFTVGGSVAGLQGSGLVLQNNSADDLNISTDGSFTFASAITDGDTYAVTVTTQPTSPGQVCSVTDNSGTLAGSDISNVTVNCVTTSFTVAGNVTGLQAGGLVLQNNAGDDLTVNADGNFTFATPLLPGNDYLVSIAVTPNDPNHACYATQNQGTAITADVVDVIITCESLAGHFIDPITELDATSVIAVGDLDGDGDTDMVVGNNLSGGAANTVWFNDGKGGYTDSGQTLGNGTTFDIVLGDIDVDGDLDIFVANFSDSESKLWLNDGTGIFSDSLQSFGAGWTTVAIGDIDSDNDLDLIAGFYGANRVLLNDGSGIFTDDQQTLGSYNSLGMAMGDLDGDGDLDLAVANYSQGDRVWFNDGSGVFSDSGQSFNTNFSYTYDIVLGDTDNDGDLDMVTADQGEGNRVRLNNGAGLFTEDQVLGTGASFAIALGDLDKDGDLDLVEGISSNTTPNAVWINTAGVFSLKQSLGTDSYTKSTTAVALADIDGDADLDMLAGNMGHANTVALNNGAGLLSLVGQRLGGNGTTRYLVFGDLDADADVERVARGLVFDNDAVGNYLNTGNDVSCYNNLSSVTLDVDADSDLDIVAGCYNTSNIYLNDGCGSFSLSANTLVQGGTAFNAEVMVKGDLDSDGDMDIVIGNTYGSFTTQINTVWLNNSDGTFTRTTDIPANYTTGLALGDVDSDGDLDMVEANAVGSASLVWFGNGDGTFINSGNSLLATNAQSVAMGDIDADGDLDIVLGDDDDNGTLGAADTIWLNNGSGNFSLSSSTLPASNTSSLDLGDLDGDGDLDLLVGEYINGLNLPIQLLLNNGLGSFTAHLQLGASETLEVKLVDVDTDGDLDIATGNEGGIDTIYFNQSR